MFNTKNRTGLEFIVCLFLVVIIFVVFWQIPSYDFIDFDDEGYIVRNYNLDNGITPESIRWAFSLTNIVYWHPLTWLSHMLDCSLFGLRPGMHHVSSLFLHIANTLLLFFTLKRMTGALLQSVFVAALFAVHPLNVESVVWLAERKNVLSTFFWMLTMFTYARYAERPGLYRYLVTFFVFALGLMAKPMLVTLPFVLFLFDYWPLCRFKLVQPDGMGHGFSKSIPSVSRWSLVLRLVLEKVPFLSLSAVCIYLSSLSVRHLKIIISTESVPVKLRLANALVSYVSYIGKMICPHNLAVYYPYPEALPLWQVVGAGLLLVCISVLVFYAAKQRPYLAIGWLWYIGTLVPVIGLVQAGLWPAMADRFAYVPLIGLFIIIAWSIPQILAIGRYKQTILFISAVAVLTATMICSWFQVRHWQNSLTLFTHTLEVTHNDNYVHYLMGLSLNRQGKLDEAIFHYNKSLQIRPNHNAYFGLGHISYQHGKLDEAIALYDKSIQMNPNFALAHNNLGIAMARKGTISEAIDHCYKAIKIDPEYAISYYNLGKIFHNQGQIEKAVLNYREALRIHPKMTQALYNLSWIMATSENKVFRNGLEAVKLAEKLCKLQNYSQPLSLDALAAAYAEAGKFDMAVKTAQQGLNVALRQGPEELAEGLENRLKLYHAGRPYRQNSHK